MGVKRIAWIDIVRALGMLLIIIGHTLFTYQFSYFARAVFAVHVPIFFVLSGYLFRKKPLKKQLRGLFSSLLLPYIFTAGVIVLLSILINKTILRNLTFVTSLGPSRASVLAGLYGIGTGTKLTFLNNHSILAIGAIWFLLAMFIGSVIFNLLQYIVPEGKYKFFVLWLLSIVLLFISTKTQYGLLPWSFNAGLMSVIFYTFGYTLQQFNFLNSISIWLVGLGIILWGLSIWSGFFYVNVAYAGNLLLAVLGAFGGSIVICWVAQHLTQSMVTKLLLPFGRYSLIVLCAHVLDLDILRIASGINGHLVAAGMPVLGVILAIEGGIVN
ncbi:acyltransferase family protein [Loigolactobacillus coryniformis]|uniref:acyltransferase family protein n=1 Tax=Loigolactobacillus coryniformis TaxID=1610 RepID=UPI00201AB57C|nr:acyltransferase family protein [Loigolactobacillus coryniformis]MCL5459591.1 acyltransferase family protein [Loigolactobacillus coryniformis]